MTTTYNSSSQSRSVTLPVEVRNGTEIEISKLLYRIIDKFYLIIIAAVICGLMMGNYAKNNSQVQYSATSQAFLANNVDALQTLGIADLQLGEFLKEDYVAAFSNRHVHEEVISKLNLPYTPEIMSTKISAAFREDSHLIYIQAIGETPEEAILLANTYVEVATYFVSELIQNDTAAVWETAVTAVQYETMPFTTYLRYGIFGGVILALVLIILFAVFDDKIRVPDEIERYFALSSFGVITKQKKIKPPSGIPVLVCAADNSSAYIHIANQNRPNQIGQDMFNTIAANLKFSIHHKNVIAVTSCANRDGKSYLTMQLGRTLAQSGHRVVIVDGDLRKSSLNSKYALCRTAGARNLEDYLTGQCEMDSCICRTNIENLSLIPCKSNHSNPVPLLSSPEFSELIQVLSEEYDIVLVDTPNAARTVDAANIIHYCDGVLFVAAYAHTKRRHVKDMIRKLNMTNCPILGFVINKVRFDCMLSRKNYWVLRNR